MIEITFETRFAVLLDESGAVIGKYEHPENGTLAVIDHDNVLWVDDRDEFSSYETPDEFPP